MDFLVNPLKNFRNSLTDEEKVIYYALVLSLLVHLVALTFLSVVKVKKVRRSVKQIEVTFRNPKVKKEISEEALKRLEVLKEEKLKDEIKILTKTSNFPTVGTKAKVLSPLSGMALIKDKQTQNIKTLEGKRKVSVPLLKSEKISNPSYLSYNETIRQKIKQRAYTYVNDPAFQAGEVYLTFVLKADGTLQAIKIIDERTKANNYLRSIGLRSIKESSPFPPFPKDFNYPELTFNIVISFEVE